MARLETLVDRQSLKTQILQRFLGWELDEFHYLYDASFDALAVMLVAPGKPTIVHYLDVMDGDIAVLYEPQSLEIVGFQIENFMLRFVPEQMPQFKGQDFNIGTLGWEKCSLKEDRVTSDSLLNALRFWLQGGMTLVFSIQPGAV